MTTYRLLNDIFTCHEAFVDFKALRKQCNDVKVWFPQENTTLLDKLKGNWEPVDVSFESDNKKNATPDISIWNLSCLVLSSKAYDALKTILNPIGEFLPLKNGYYLFNCLNSVGGDAINQNKTAFKIEQIDANHIPASLEFLPEKIANKPLFKPGFSENSFLISQDDFKKITIQHGLKGIIFEENLAAIFPSQK